MNQLPALLTEVTRSVNDNSFSDFELYYRYFERLPLLSFQAGSTDLYDRPAQTIREMLERDDDSNSPKENPLKGPEELEAKIQDLLTKLQTALPELKKSLAYDRQSHTNDENNIAICKTINYDSNYFTGSIVFRYHKVVARVRVTPGVTETLTSITLLGYNEQDDVWKALTEIGKTYVTPPQIRVDEINIITQSNGEFYLKSIPLVNNKNQNFSYENYNEGFQEISEKVLATLQAEDESTNGLVLFHGDPGTGKAQPLTSKILTPTGWITMGELQIGTVISTPDGKTAKVLEVFPQGKKDIYEIKFHDGSSTRCCLDHLWEVYYSKYSTRKAEKQILSTSQLIQLMEKMEHKDYCNNISIPIITAQEYIHEEELPIDPYLLGCLIGDGGLTGSSIIFSSADPDLIENISISLDNGYTLQYQDQYDYRLVHEGNRQAGCAPGTFSNTYRQRLHDLKLLGCNSLNKFIPDMYKQGTIKQRLELIRGLFDTDGTAGNRQGDIQFYTSSKKLALDVQEVIQSLGGLCTISSRINNYTYLDEVLEGSTSYTCYIAYPQPSELFKLNRKKNRCRNIHADGRVQLRRRISSIEKVGNEEAQCILIDHPDHLYITDNYIVTHNTSYLKYMLHTISKKKLIYLPPDLIEHLSSPNFVTFLMSQATNSILLIEDAENVLKHREVGGSQAVSNILNISDGILGDVLRLKIVCTFNSPLDQIDSALLRPGRLITEYRFEPLAKDRASHLMRKLHGEDIKFEPKAMTLAEIFNFKKMPEKSPSKKQKVGFM